MTQICANSFLRNERRVHCVEGCAIMRERGRGSKNLQIDFKTGNKKDLLPSLEKFCTMQSQMTITDNLICTRLVNSLTSYTFEI